MFHACFAGVDFFKFKSSVVTRMQHANCVLISMAVDITLHNQPLESREPLNRLPS